MKNQKRLQSPGLFCAVIANVFASTSVVMAGSSRMVFIDGLGKIPEYIVIKCEQSTGDGGHEFFFDAQWEMFSDCVHDGLIRTKKTRPRRHY